MRFYVLVIVFSVAVQCSSPSPQTGGGVGGGAQEPAEGECDNLEELEKKKKEKDDEWNRLIVKGNFLLTKKEWLVGLIIEVQNELYEEEDEGAKVHLETKLEVLREELEKCGEEQEEVDKKTKEVKDCLKDLKERIKRCKKEAKEEDGKKG